MEKLRDQETRNYSNIRIGGSFEPLMNIDETEELTIALTETLNILASEVLGKAKKLK